MVAIDLHTHSIASPDGGIRPEQYAVMLASGILDYIAITDHNTITTAQRLHNQLGERIIVGEEITTTDGDIIGLYLTELIPKGLSAQEAAKRIHAQGGLVYAAHPFERVRKGIGAHILTALGDDIDIIEGYNGRSLSRNSNRAAAAWATTHHIAAAASSDAHGWHGWGNTYTQIPIPPTKETLKKLLETARLITHRPTVRGALYPKLNRLRKHGMNT
jgi:predicted metal-dependent phosphoesterase TrpH